MNKPIPFFAESLNTLKHALGHDFMHGLNKQVAQHDFDSQGQGNASATDETPKYIDSITFQEIETDSHKYLKHISNTVDKALSTEPDANKYQYELTRIIDNPYSLLVLFEDSSEENKVALSLLHHASSNGNTDAMNELASFYAPPEHHYKYTENPHTNPQLALKLLTQSSNLGSADAAARLAEIHDCMLVEQGGDLAKPAELAQPQSTKNPYEPRLG